HAKTGSRVGLPGQETLVKQAEADIQASEADVTRSPILLGLALHGWRGRILDFEPVIDTAGAIVRAESLRDDGFGAERARMTEDACAVAAEMLIEGDAIANVSEEVGHRRLHPIFYRRFLPPDLYRSHRLDRLSVRQNQTTVCPHEMRGAYQFHVLV